MNRASPQIARSSPSIPWFWPAVALSAIAAATAGYALASRDKRPAEARLASAAFTNSEKTGALNNGTVASTGPRPRDPIESFITGFHPPRGPLRAEHELYSILQQWTVDDFRALARDEAAKARILKKLRHPIPSCDAVTRGFIDRWMELDPAAADSVLDWARSIEDDDAWEDDNFVASSIREAVGRRTPEAMFSRIKSLKAGLDKLTPSERKKRIEEIDSVAGDLMTAVAETDPATAERLVAEFSGEQAHTSLKAEWLKGLAKSDPLRAVDLIDSKMGSDGAPGVWRAAIAGARIQGLGQLSLLQSKATKFGIRAEIAMSIADLDLNEGVRIAGELMSSSPGGARDWRFERIAGKLAQSDPLRATEWVDSLPDAARRFLLPTVVSDWTAVDPAGAMNWISNHPQTEAADPIRGPVLGDDQRALAFRSWMMSDEHAAQAWLDSQPSENRPALQAGFLEFLVSGGRTAEAAQRFSEWSLSDESLARTITQKFAGEDPLKAMNWAVQLPPGPIQEAASSIAINAWGRTEPKAAGDWLQQLPSGLLRDRAIASYSGLMSVANAADSSAWVAQIEDPWQRSRAAQAVYHNWWKRDPKAARSWFEGLDGIDPVLKRITLGELRLR